MSRFRYGDDIEPMRIERPSFAQLPSVEYLARLAERAEWLMIQVPTSVNVGGDGNRSDTTLAERERYVSELTALLPAHQVWDCGFLPDEASPPVARWRDGTVLTGMAGFGIRRPVTEQALEENLARQLKVDVSEFAENCSWHGYKRDGLLQKQAGDEDTDGEWGYFFHGYDCAFTSRATGVTVEARLGYGPACGEDFGVLDPWFFLGFINSDVHHNPEYLILAEMLRDWGENARLAVEFMERRGVLRRVSSEAVTWRGWVLAGNTSD